MEKAAGQDPKKLAKLARLAATTPPLHAVENFIVALTAANDGEYTSIFSGVSRLRVHRADGRISLSLSGDQLEIKYQHLNPATYFQEVVESARSVVLAGGTMSPVSSLNQGFARRAHCALCRSRMLLLNCSLSSRQSA